jgi:hypothetical protein
MRDHTNNPKPEKICNFGFRIFDWDFHPGRAVGGVPIKPIPQMGDHTSNPKPEKIYDFGFRIFDCGFSSRQGRCWCSDKTNSLMEELHQQLETQKRFTILDFHPLLVFR